MTEPESELYDDRERFELLQRIRDAEDALTGGLQPHQQWIEDTREHARRVADPESFLRRVDAYLTQRCDLAYLAYYSVTRGPRATYADYASGDVSAACDSWTELGDARELVRRPLRELERARLKPVRTKIHADYFREKGGE